MIYSHFKRFIDKYTTLVLKCSRIDFIAFRGVLRGIMKGNKGFTILELSIVISIIAIMSSLMWSAFNRFKAKTENATSIYECIEPLKELEQECDYEKLYSQAQEEKEKESE